MLCNLVYYYCLRDYFLEKFQRRKNFINITLNCLRDPLVKNLQLPENIMSIALNYNLSTITTSKSK